jgi:hypothetical protein
MTERQGRGGRRGGRRQAPRLHEVIFEFTRIGRYVKVAAIDPESGTEATITGPPDAGREALQALARRKLEYVLAKRGRGGRGGFL